MKRQWPPFLWVLGVMVGLGGFGFFRALSNLSVTPSLSGPGMPLWPRSPLAASRHPIPPDSDGIDETVELRDGPSPVGYDGYTVADNPQPSGLPVRGPIRHWSCNDEHEPVCELVLLGCVFHDPVYASHTGWDLPLAVGQNVYATMSGQVIWAGDNGPWGKLVVIENNGFQIWLAHLSKSMVNQGDRVLNGAVIGLSGSTGHSSGPHVHYGIKHFDDPDDETGTWLDPAQFVGATDFAHTPCGG